MSPRTEEQYESIRSSRRFQIMEAALEVFAESGFHQASIAQVAKRAEISKGLIYNYFASKEDLLKAVLLQGIEGLKVSTGEQEDQMNTPEELRLFIEGGLQTMQEESHYYQLYFSILMQPAAYHIIKDNYHEIMGDLLAQVTQYFKKQGDPHPEEKAVILAALLDGVGIHYLMFPEKHDLKVYQQIIYDLFK